MQRAMGGVARACLEKAPGRGRGCDRWLRAVLLAMGVMLVSACVTVSGDSSRKMKRKLESSFLFTSLSIFYPDGVPLDPRTLPPINRRRESAINETYTAHLKQTLQLHRTVASDLGVLFDRPIPKELRAKLHVESDEGRRNVPRARMEANGDLVVSTKVAQALFRTAIVLGMQSGEIGGPRFMDEGEPLPDDSVERERALIQQFNELVAKTRAAKGQTVVADVFEGFGDEELEGAWFTMADLAMTSNVVHQHYNAPIRFLIAHEVGHLALGHFSQQAPATDRACYMLEREADLYAIALVAYWPDLQQADELAKQFVADLLPWGHEEFFSTTYDLAEFAPAAGSASCAYQSAAERLAFLEQAKERLLSAGDNPPPLQQLLGSIEPLNSEGVRSGAQ
jgi:hypothetical protein